MEGVGALEAASESGTGRSGSVPTRVAPAWRVLPPLLVFALLRVLYATVTGSDLTSMQPETWSRYDSGNYASIALEGYYWDTCENRGVPEQGEVCSNTPWYPLLPALMWVTMEVTGLSDGPAGIWVSQLAELAVLFVLWNAFLGPRPSLRGGLLLLLGALFPGGVYYLAQFPNSLLCLFMLLQIWCFGRRRWWWGAGAGFVAGLTYPVAIVLAPASAIWVLLVQRPWVASPGDSLTTRLRRWTPAAGVGGVVAAGTMTVLLLHEAALGRSLASIDAQRQIFRARTVPPWQQWWQVVVERDSWLQQYRTEVAWPMAAQTLLVAVIVAVAVLVTLRARDRGPDDIALGILVLALWLLPLVNQVDTGLYRRESAVLPAVILLRRAPSWLIAVLVVASAAVWWPMADLYHRYVIY